jgi:hypothetical protein
VRYVVTPHEVLTNVFPVLERFPGDRVYPSGQRYRVLLHGNPGCLPRAFLVSRTRSVGSDGGARASAAMARMLSDPGFDPRREVLIAGAEVKAPVEEPALPVDGLVQFVESTPHRIRLRVDAPQDCWLFLSDTWYPGWRAEIDGTGTPVLRANLFGRAVRIPAGSHEVVFRFSPASLHLGVGLAVVSGLLLAAWLGVGARRSASRSRIERISREGEP